MATSTERAVPAFTTGTATSTKSGGVCTALVNGYVETVQVARDLTVAVGDVLLVHRVAAIKVWVASARLYTAAPASVTPDGTVPPDPNPSSVTGRTAFLPTYTGSYRGSWRTDTDDLIQGVYGMDSNSTGVALYGRALLALEGATILGATLAMQRAPGGATSVAATLTKIVSGDPQTGTAPTTSGTLAAPALAEGGIADAVTVTTSWVSDMAAGTAVGLGIFNSAGTTYDRLYGIGTYAPSFTLTVDWSR